MVTEQKQAAEDGPYVYLDPFLIRRRQINLGLSQTQLVGAMQVSPNTAKGHFEETRSIPARHIDLRNS
ncbi:MAG: hypothetical protein WKF77_31630 [Planctomycetaceae bacterium]